MSRLSIVVPRLSSTVGKVASYFLFRLWFACEKLFLRLNRTQWEKLYGSFDETNYDRFTLVGLPNESGVALGEIVKWAQDISPPPKRALLAGETKSVASIYGKKIRLGCIETAGLGNVDHEWNFEHSPPEMDKYDLIISQAVLEHLVNPYKHISDLASLLTPGGFLIVHTVVPGFPYHRYPIDTCRFHPDWFEEMAKRLGVDIVKKRIHGTYLFYMYRKVA
jgi:SAM-dependent methyltransferase